MIDNLESIYAQDRRSGNLHGSPVSGGGPGRFLFQEVEMENGLCKCGCGYKTNISTRNNLKYGWIKGKRVNFLRGHNQKKENHWNWKVGKSINKKGYVTIGNDYEHILVAESVIGRKINFPNEIHHVNGDRSDNRKENLVICENRKYHRLLHARKRALLICGDANKKSCIFCKKFDLLENLVLRNKKDDKGYCHRKCESEYAKKRYIKTVLGLED